MQSQPCIAADSALRIDEGLETALNTVAASRGWSPEQVGVRAVDRQAERVKGGAKGNRDIFEGLSNNQEQRRLKETPTGRGMGGMGVLVCGMEMR